jgi:hypothetical protein
MWKTFLTLIITGVLFITAPVPGFAGVWEAMTGALPTARYGHTMVEYDGALFVFGGMSEGNGSATRGDPDPPNPLPRNNLWKYKAQQWEQLTPTNPPSPRHGHAATVDTTTGKMYIHGGINTAGTVLNDLWAYDFSTNTFTQATSTGTPAPRYNHSIAALPDGSQGGRIVIFGGRYSASYLHATNPYAWCPTTGAWYPKNAPSFDSIEGQTALAKDNTMVIVGGSKDGSPAMDIWQFDLTANSWTRIIPTGSSPDPRLFHSMVPTSNGFRIFGGETGASAGKRATDNSDAWEFNYTAGTWTRLPSMPIPISQGAAAKITIDGKEKDVLFGGLTGSSYVNTSYAYVPDAANPVLTVAVTGSGTVVSDPSGINCGNTCTAAFTSGTRVTLTAEAGAGSSFAGWSGCSATDGNFCFITMTEDAAVTASFSANTCTYTYTPKNRKLTYKAGSVTVNITGKGAKSCPAPAVAIVEGEDWMSLSPVTFAKNRGKVTVSVAENTTSSGRDGEVSIAGGPFPVTQTGKPCALAISPASSALIPKAGGTGTFTVTATPDDCPWTAQSGTGWVAVTSGASGTGSGTVAYEAGPNTGKGGRNGKINVSLGAGKTKKVYTVRQGNK